MFRLTTTAQFEKRLARFIRRHPDLKADIRRTFLDLERDPFAPHLHLHPLKGQLKGLFAVSITYHYRITLTLQFSEKEIVLLDIGTHDELYR